MDDMIKRYREGSLTHAERHALEKKALSDPLLADALEGAESVSAETFSADLKNLSEKLQHRPKQSWFTPVRIAAGILLLITVGYVAYFTVPGKKSSSEFSEEESNERIMSKGGGLGKTDSAKSMLSLTKPDATGEKEKRSQPPPVVVKKNETTRSGDSKPDKELSKESEKILAQQQEEEKLKTEKIAEDQAIVSPPELADNKKEDLTATELSSASGAGARDEGKLDRRSAALRRSSDDISEKVVEGKVISAVDGAPLPGVTVVLKGTDTGTVTDAKGNFSIAMAQTKPLVFSFIGFQPVEVSSDKPVIDVVMNEDVSQLGEVVVTGRAIPKDDAREPVVRMAAPLVGIKAYDKYLESNLRYPPQALESKVKGKVTVSFTVTVEGALTEFTVVRGLGHGCDDEVIRLVKEGPKWTPTFLDDVAIESEVKVKMKFDPEKANK